MDTHTDPDNLFSINIVVVTASYLGHQLNMMDKKRTFFKEENLIIFLLTKDIVQTAIDSFMIGDSNNGK